MDIYGYANKAKEAFKETRKLDEFTRNKVLEDFSSLLKERCAHIISENEKDLKEAKADSMSKAFIDRLTLNEERISSIAQSVLKVKELEDPLNRVLEERDLESGIHLKKLSVPIGLIGIIFESRPNVAADCAALCFKSGNTCILKGGKEAYNSCKAIVDTFKEALVNNGVNEDAVVLPENMDHMETKKLMECKEYVDLLIPRGSSRLINAVVDQAKIPVIETGAGICHVFVDKSADLNMAKEIVINAKCQRPSVCNALETLLVHKDIAKDFLPVICDELSKRNVIIHGDEKSKAIISYIEEASEENYHTEYNDLEMNLKVVDSLKEAIDHIEFYGTHHSDCIVTEDEENVKEFFSGIDSACLYHNASIRFTDGELFGLGAEIGISTQKMHARGPMGLTALTTYTYLLEGKGQIR